MPHVQTDAIVLRTYEFSETSLVVHLFTRSEGKIHALAKGARRPKGPFESALDLLSVCRIAMIEKSGDSLDLLTEAKLERRFRAGTKSLPHVYAALYAAEVLERTTELRDPHPELFDEGSAAIFALDRLEPIQPTLFRFETQALKSLGFRPTLDRCVGCGGSAPDGDAWFSLMDGGILCAGCRAGRKSVVRIRAATRQALDELLRRTPSADPAPPAEFPQSVNGELRGLINQFFNHLNGSQFRLQEAISRLSRTPRAKKPVAAAELTAE
jgi:DNA repair protein RecO (recombination protein O)